MGDNVQEVCASHNLILSCIRQMRDQQKENMEKIRMEIENLKQWMEKRFFQLDKRILALEPHTEEKTEPTPPEATTKEKNEKGGK